MFCHLYDAGGRGSAGAPANHTKLINTAHDVKNITSRLIKTGFFAPFSVAAEKGPISSVPRVRFSSRWVRELSGGSNPETETDPFAK